MVCAVDHDQVHTVLILPPQLLHHSLTRGSQGGHPAVGLKVRLQQCMFLDVIHYDVKRAQRVCGWLAPTHADPERSAACWDKYTATAMLSCMHSLPCCTMTPAATLQGCFKVT